MKKSEHQKKLAQRIRESPVISNWTETACAAATELAEEAIRNALDRINRSDITELWDPEEPELPVRVWRPKYTNVLLPEGKTLQDVGTPEARGYLIRQVIDEAAARYNAVGKTLLMLHRSIPLADEDRAGVFAAVLQEIQGFLRRERERLQ